MKKRTRRILIAALAAVFAVSLGVVAYQQLQYGKNDRAIDDARRLAGVPAVGKPVSRGLIRVRRGGLGPPGDRKSTRLNSSHIA